MIVVELHEAPDGRVIWFRVMGHAGFDATGRDIVCAGVSAIAQVALRAMRDVPGMTGAYTDDGDALTVRPDWEQPGTPTFPAYCQAKAFMEAAAMGFREIARAYPGHVALNAVTDKEGPH